MRHREALEDFVGCSLEDFREGLLDQRNQLFAEEIEVLVDGLVDDVGNGSVAVEERAEVDAALLHENFDLKFVDDEMCDAVYFFWPPADSDFTASREVSCEHPGPIDRQNENFSVHAVLSVYKQVRQIYFKRILRGVFNDAEKRETDSITTVQPEETRGRRIIFASIFLTSSFSRPSSTPRKP